MTEATAGILALGLVLGTLVIMASRTLAPVKEKPKGAVELEMRLPLMQRALAQKMNVISICAVVALAGGALTSQRIISPVVGYLALLVMIGLILKRQTLVVTSQGVLVHNAAFRPWKDFDDVTTRPGKIVLHSSTRLASLSLYLPSKKRDEVARLVRHHIGRGRAQAAAPIVARAVSSAPPVSRSARKGRRNRG
jgi:hypothetical protein